MSSDLSRGLLDSFDVLIKGNQQQLDELYDRSGATSSRATTIESEGEVRWPVNLNKDNVGKGQSISWLDKHFPDAWRYDIRDRRRQDNEVIVLCRLELTDYQIHKSQFGRATLPETESGEYRNERQAESAAYELAVDDALCLCIQYL